MKKGLFFLALSAFLVLNVGAQTKLTADTTKYNIRYGSGSFFDNLGDKTIYDEFKLKVNLLVK